MRKIIICLLAVAALVACGESEETRQQLSRADKTRLRKLDSLALKVAVMPTLDALPLFVAKEERLFDTLHVDVRLRMHTAQMDCDTAIVGRSVEGFVTDLVRAERLRDKGHVALRYVTATNAYWQLVSNKQARIKKLDQMGDKMIAMTRFSATDLLASLAIDSGKPKDAVFRIQVNDVRLRLSMLLNNEMDLLLLTEPYATTARLHKHPVLMDSREKGVCLGAIAFRESALKDKRRQQQLKLFLKAYDMACDSINKNGVGHYDEIIRKYCKTDEKTLAALPALRYSHATQPRQADIDRAKRFLK